MTRFNCREDVAATVWSMVRSLPLSRFPRNGDETLNLRNDTDADEFDILDLAMTLEEEFEEFGVTIEDEELEPTCPKYATVGAIIDEMWKRVQESPTSAS